MNCNDVNDVNDYEGIMHSTSFFENLSRGKKSNGKSKVSTFIIQDTSFSLFVIKAVFGICRNISLYKNFCFIFSAHICKHWMVIIRNLNLNRA